MHNNTTQHNTIVASIEQYDRTERRAAILGTWLDLPEQYHAMLLDLATLLAQHKNNRLCYTRIIITSYYYQIVVIPC